MLPPSRKGKAKKTVEEATNADSKQWQAQQNSAATSIFDAIIALRDAQQAQTCHEDRNDKKNRALSVVTIGLVFLTVIFTGLSWCAFRDQLEEMQRAYGPIKESADAAKKAAEAAKLSADATIALERPYFFITGKFIQNKGDNDPNPQIQYTITNIGRVPGIARMIYTDCFITGALDKIPVYKKGKFRTAQSAISGNNSLADFPPTICENITAEDYAAVKAKTKGFVFQALVMYEGALDFTYAIASTYSIDITANHFFAVGGPAYNYDTSEKGRPNGNPPPLPKIIE
jgi:hypothetical protein